MSLKGIRVSVIGGSESSEEILSQAFRLGKLLAEEGCIVYTGGKGGVMEAVSKGVSDGGGIVVGILPEPDTSEMNPYVQIPVCTGVGLGRNAILVQSADVIVAVNGKYGTLSEIAIALQLGKPIIGLHTWTIDKNIVQVESPEKVITAIQKVVGASE
jgi:hypothetical protein